MINLFDFYGRRGDFADICLIIFSKEIHRHLLDSYESEIIATMPACNGDTHIYKTTYKGVTITFYLSGIGSAVASSQCHLASWLTGASKFIMFGSCGSLDRTTTQGRFIIPTQSYRGDGCSYYFAAPSDYIDIAASKDLSIIFDKLSVPEIGILPVDGIPGIKLRRLHLEIKIHHRLRLGRELQRRERHTTRNRVCNLHSQDALACIRVSKQN